MLWDNDGFLLGRDGSDPGVIANMQYDQHNKMGFILMSNVSAFDDANEEAVEEAMRKLTHWVYRRGMTLKAERE